MNYGMFAHLPTLALNLAFYKISELALKVHNSRNQYNIYLHMKCGITPSNHNVCHVRNGMESLRLHMDILIHEFTQLLVFCKHSSLALFA